MKNIKILLPFRNRCVGLKFFFLNSDIEWRIYLVITDIVEHLLSVIKIIKVVHFLRFFSFSKKKNCRESVTFCKLQGIPTSYGPFFIILIMLLSSLELAEICHLIGYIIRKTFKF